MEPILPEAYTLEYYEFLAWRYLLNDTWSWSRIRSVLRALRPQPGERILDAGCGMGTFTIEGRKRGAKVIGIDYALTALTVAKSLGRWILKTEHLPLLQGSVYALPFANGYFDKIIAADVVEHLTPKEFDLFVQEVERVLKPGGYVVIRTPNPVNIITAMAEEIERASENYSLFPLSSHTLKHTLKRFLYKFLLTLYRKGKRWWLSREFANLCKELNMEHASFSVLPAATVQAMNKKYNFLHVELKTVQQILQTFRRYSCRLCQVTVSQSDLKFQNLPFPLNTYWGGHMTIVLRKSL